MHLFAFVSTDQQKTMAIRIKSLHRRIEIAFRKMWSRTIGFCWHMWFSFFSLHVSIFLVQFRKEYIFWFLKLSKDNSMYYKASRKQGFICNHKSLELFVEFETQTFGFILRREIKKPTCYADMQWSTELNVQRWTKFDC